MAIALLSTLCLARAHAQELAVQVHDSAGAPVDNAIVALYSDDTAIAAGTKLESRGNVVDQVGKRFVPRVTAIHAGDRISFPNSDNIRHHVYSFSPVKPFELPLYHGTPTDPVVFENAGKVVLGCNIHDQMSAHIYVLDTSLYGQTANGAYTFANVKPGAYQLAVFHPRQDEAQDRERRRVVVDERATQSLEVTVNLPAPAPVDDTRLSPLERKFKALRRGQD